MMVINNRWLLYTHTYYYVVPIDGRHPSTHRQLGPITVDSAWPVDKFRAGPNVDRVVAMAPGSRECPSGYG
jgi:hypothetical protein